MSKIAEQKALKAYPKRFVGTDFIHIDGDANYDFRIGFIKGYDQAKKDFFEFERKTHFPTDELGDAYRYGYEQALQDFLKKAEKYLQNTLYDRVEIKVFGTLIPTIVCKNELIDNFKNYMQNEM